MLIILKYRNNDTKKLDIDTKKPSLVSPIPLEFLVLKPERLPNGWITVYKKFMRGQYFSFFFGFKILAQNGKIHIRITIFLSKIFKKVARFQIKT
jgi:hypothetical protein